MKTMKNQMQLHRILRVILSFLSVIAYLMIPCMFAWVFHGDNGSSFLDFWQTSMSVEFWGSFWISYISLGITAFLTFQAFNLSIRLGENQDLQQMEIDKKKFTIYGLRFLGE